MWLVGIPIPPSLNNAYPTSRYGVRMKSQELQLWERDFQTWAFLNHSAVRVLREYFKSSQPNHFLQVDCVYRFEKGRILTKQGKTKRLDVDNRLKHLLDAVTTLIGIDDSLIWKGTFIKIPSENDDSSCDVNIGWVTLGEIKISAELHNRVQ
jgi:Holliday junction resolvase RusA-like endonuclease